MRHPVAHRSSDVRGGGTSGGIPLEAAVVAGAAALIVAVAAAGPQLAHTFAHFQVVELLGIRIGGGHAYLAFWIAGGVGSAIAFLAVARVQSLLTPASIAAGPIFTLGFLYGAVLQGRLEEGASLVKLIAPSELVGSDMRFPLGLLIGGGAAYAWSVVTRTSWLAVGDRLAVAAAVWESIGRLGCLVTGCCLGHVCPAWMSGLCARYPAGTDAFLDQVRVGIVDAVSPFSEPLHVLPAYFSLAALAIAVGLVSLLRRGAPRGTLLATFAIAYPLVKLTLESLRAAPRPGPLMTAVPAVILAVGFGTLWYVRRTGYAARARNCAAAGSRPFGTVTR